MRRTSIHLAQNVKQQTCIPFLVRIAVGQVLVKVCLHWNYTDQWTQHLGTTCHCTLKLELTSEENRTMTMMILYMAGLSVCQPVVAQMLSLIKVIHLTCRINFMKTIEVTVHIKLLYKINRLKIYLIHRGDDGVWLKLVCSRVPSLRVSIPMLLFFACVLLNTATVVQANYTVSHPNSHCCDNTDKCILH